MTSRHFIVVVLAAYALCVGVSGCAGPQLSIPDLFAKNGEENQVQTVTTHPTLPSGDGLVGEAQTAESPFVDPPNARREPAGVNTAMKPNAEELPFPQFSVDTRRMIADEFRDASDDDRDSWYDVLRNIGEDKVPGILNVRRALADGPARPTDRQSIERDRVAQASYESERSQTRQRPPYVDEYEPRPTVVEPGPRNVGHTTRNRDWTAEQRPQVFPGERVDRRWNQPPPASDEDYAGRHTGYDEHASSHESEMGNVEERRAPTVQDESARRATWPPNDRLASEESSDAGRRGDVQNSGYVEMPKASEQIQPASSAAPAREDDGKYALANDWDTQLRRVIGIIEDDVARRPSPANDDERAERIKLQTYLRLLYLMDGQETRSLQAIPDMPAAHQEFWTQLFWGLTNYFDDDGIPDPGHRASETITQLRAAVEKLKPEARLQLRNATFSHKINSFGNYERFDRDEFQAGQPVLVYVEVQNFASEMGSEGLYRTRLRSSIEVHRVERGRSSQVVHTQQIPVTEDTCRNLRQDYFHSYLIDLPANLSPGPHVLKLMVEDELSHRVATASLNFVVR